MRKGWQPLLGFVVIFIGLCIIVEVIGFGHSLLGPFFLAGIGMLFYRYVHRWVGLFFLILALITFFNNVLHMDIAGMLFAFLFIYIGVRLLRGKDGRPHRRDKAFRRSPSEKGDTKQRFSQREMEERATHSARSEPEEEPPHVRLEIPHDQRSWVGDLHLDYQFELKDMTLSCGIGDVKIDLSKAIVPEGETTVDISGFMGDVDIYVPYDLDVSTVVSVTFGNLEILGYKQGGINRQLRLATKGYEQARRKVKISVSMLIGDVDVRYL